MSFLWISRGHSKDRKIRDHNLDMTKRPLSGLPEVDVDPLGDLMLDFLIEWDKEETFLDFKATLSIAKNAPFAKIAKDILAFSNYGGGFILIGFSEKPKTQDTLESEEKRTPARWIGRGLPY